MIGRWNYLLRTLVLAGLALLAWLAWVQVGGMVGRHEEGLAVDRRLVELLPLDARVRYNLACSCALAGTYQEALAALEDAVRLGFRDVNLMRKDHDLDPLRDDPRYIAIESRIAGAG